MKVTALILAAGHGTRMHSRLPKMLHALAGKPLVMHALENAARISDEPPVVVVGQAEEAAMRQVIGSAARLVIHAEKSGPRPAVLAAESLLAGQTDLVLVSFADMPLINPETLRQVIAAQRTNPGPVSLLTRVLPVYNGLRTGTSISWRVARGVDGADGADGAIIEEAQPSPKVFPPIFPEMGPEQSFPSIIPKKGGVEELAIRELNAGVFCFRSDWLWPALERISQAHFKAPPSSPQQAQSLSAPASSPPPLSRPGRGAGGEGGEEGGEKGEFSLIDLVEMAAADGLEVRAVTTADPAEALSIHTRVHLAVAEGILRQRINTAWMLAGVTLIDPATTYIEAGVTIGADTVIWPNTYLRGQTRIGEGCEIGPNTIIEDCQVGDQCTILAAVIEKSILEDQVSMGPFAHLRPNVRLGKGVHMGNFGEIKNSTLAQGTKVGHFSYIGDATIGENVNIGAGTITCNYDGHKKHKTVIGANAFIGSDTMLVAPLNIGEGAKTGAGAVVTHDVPAGGLVVGVPARPLQKREARD